MTKQYQLPKEFAERWVAALRSTPEALRIKGVYQRKKNGVMCFCGVGLGLNANGMNYCQPFLKEIAGLLDVHSAITCLNDDENYSFKEQADWLEENVEFTDKEAQNV